MAKTTNNLTFEQQKKLLLTPCKNRQEVKNWIKYHLGLSLPDVTVSRYSDTNPLDVIFEVYRICVLKQNPDNIQELLFVAGRGSGKTLGMAIAELMILLHDKRDVVHVGAIQNQAERCYAYQKNFLYNRKLKPIVMPPDVPEDERILEKANMSKSIFNIGQDKITLEVLPCTLKACLTIDAKVELEDGSVKNIALISIGEKIKSPQGMVEVINSSIEERDCMRVELDDGRVIEGTLDHRIWTDKGWIELQHLTEDRIIL